MKTLAFIFIIVMHSSTVSAQETHVFWGDTHLHTGNSFDVYLFGTPNATTDTAIRFAKGLPVINPATQTPWQLSQPLDFVVVSDHAEAMGSIPRLYANDPIFAETKTGKLFLKLAPDQTEEQLILVTA